MLKKPEVVSTIYLKGGCFLPDNFSIYRGKQLRFANEDNSNFTIQCKGSFGIPSFRLESNGSHTVIFPKTGKFQFTSAANASLKCIIEVVELETKKDFAKPFLLYGSLGKSAESILAKKKEYEALNQLRKNRVNVTFSPFEDRGEEMEELNHIRSQRQLFKHFKSATPFSSIASVETTDEEILRIDNELNNFQETGYVFESEEHTIWIEDFDFTEHLLTAYVGDTVSFAISPSVPLHAEHMLYAVSENPLLQFESELMQVNDGSRFTFTVKSCGEMKVSCKIYHEMLCIVDVKPNTRRLKPLSMDESGITAVAIISETSMDSRTHSAHSFSSESFYDSDDVLSDTDEGENSDGNTMEDEEDEIDVHHLVSIGDHLMEDPYSEDPDDIGDLDLADILDAARLEDFIIFIDEYSFRPDKVDCSANAMVKFVLDPSYDSCTISCDGEFYGILLNGYQTTYRHQFLKSGVYEIYNESLNFMCCRVEVHTENTVSYSDFSADSGSSDHLESHFQHNNTNLSNSAASPGQPSPFRNLQYTNSNSTEVSPVATGTSHMQLFGSFLPPMKVTTASSIPSSVISNTNTQQQQPEMLPVVSLGYDHHLSDSNNGLTADEQECLQVLQDCLRYDGMENLSRAQKKRLKYKQRTKLKKHQATDDGETNNASSTVHNQPADSVLVSEVEHQHEKPGQTQDMKQDVCLSSKDISISQGGIDLTKENKKKKKKSNRSKNQHQPLSPCEGSNSHSKGEFSVSTNVSVASDEREDPESLSPSSSTYESASFVSTADTPSKLSSQSSVVSSPLKNARYAFAVADWMEDLEIVSDSDDASTVNQQAPKQPEVSQVVTKGKAEEKTSGFEECKELLKDSAPVFPDTLSADILGKENKAATVQTSTCNIISADADNAEQDQTCVDQNKGGSDSASSTSSSSCDDGESLGLIYVEDDRWMLTDEDDSSVEDRPAENDSEETMGIASSTAAIVTDDISVTETKEAFAESEEAAAVTVMPLSKRGLLLSVLGLPAAPPQLAQTQDQQQEIVSDSVSASSAASVASFQELPLEDDDSSACITGQEEAETKEEDDDMIVASPVVEEASTNLAIEQFQKKVEAQKEFVHLFIQRAKEATKKAKKGMTETLPGGKVVGVFFWEDLPLMKPKASIPKISEDKVSGIMAVFAAAPPGLPSPAEVSNSAKSSSMVATTEATGDAPRTNEVTPAVSAAVVSVATISEEGPAEQHPKRGTSTSVPPNQQQKQEAHKKLKNTTVVTENTAAAAPVLATKGGDVSATTSVAPVTQSTIAAKPTVVQPAVTTTTTSTVISSINSKRKSPPNTPAGKDKVPAKQQQASSSNEAQTVKPPPLSAATTVEATTEVTQSAASAADATHASPRLRHNSSKSWKTVIAPTISDVAVGGGAVVVPTGATSDNHSSAAAAVSTVKSVATVAPVQPAVESMVARTNKHGHSKQQQSKSNNAVPPAVSAEQPLPNSNKSSNNTPSKKRRPSMNAANPQSSAGQASASQQQQPPLGKEIKGAAAAVAPSAVLTSTSSTANSNHNTMAAAKGAAKVATSAPVTAVAVAFATTATAPTMPATAGKKLQATPAVSAHTAALNNKPSSTGNNNNKNNKTAVTKIDNSTRNDNSSGDPRLHNNLRRRGERKSTVHTSEKK